MSDTGENHGLYYSIEIDWSRCPLVESIPGKVSGAWVLKGTRMPAQVIADNFDSGMDAREIADAYDTDLPTVQAVVAFAEACRAEAQARIAASPEFAALLDTAPAPRPVDWSGCPVVEWRTGPAHGTWVLRGTPTPAALLMKHHDDGWRLENIVETYRWDEALVAELIAYGEAQRAGRGGTARART